MDKISEIFLSFMEIFPLPPSVTDQNLEVEYATFRDFLPHLFRACIIYCISRFLSVVGFGEISVTHTHEPILVYVH